MTAPVRGRGGINALRSGMGLSSSGEGRPQRSDDVQSSGEIGPADLADQVGIAADDELIARSR